MIDAVRSFLPGGSNSNLLPLAQDCYTRVHNFLSQFCHDWPEIVRLGKVCINQGLRLLNTVKDSVVKVIMQNCEISKALTQIATKSGTTLAARYATKKIAAKSTTHAIVAQSAKKGGVSVTKVAITQGAKQGAKTAVKAANVIGVAADITQAGLEYCGYENAGKKVGMTGNIASGAIFGATVGGPPGAAIGAFGGFLIWGAGEVVGDIIDKAFQS